MVRRTFDAQGEIVESQPPPSRELRAYAAAMKEVGTEKKVTVIDLHAASKTLVEKLGPAASAELANKEGDVTHQRERCTGHVRPCNERTGDGRAKAQRHFENAIADDLASRKNRHADITSLY